MRLSEIDHFLNGWIPSAAQLTSTDHKTLVALKTRPPHPLHPSVCHHHHDVKVDDDHRLTVETRAHPKLVWLNVDLQILTLCMFQKMLSF